MDAAIISISQDLSLENGETTNFIVLRLPSGVQVQAVVSDDGAAALLREASGQAPVAPRAAPEPPSAPVPEHHAALPPQDEDGAYVFGGSPEPEETDPNYAPTWSMPEPPPAPPALPPQPPIAMTAPQPQPPAPPAQPVRPMTPEQQVRAYRQKRKAEEERQNRQPTMGRMVPKDDAGNPIVPRAPGTVDPRSLVGGGTARDEEGVGSI